MGKVEVAAGGNQRIHPKIDQETTKEEKSPVPTSQSLEHKL